MFFFFILCLKIIQHGTINSAFIYILIYIYTFLKNDGLSYTLDSFNFFENNISYIDFIILFNLFQLFSFFILNFRHLCHNAHTDTAPVIL